MKEEVTKQEAPKQNSYERYEAEMANKEPLTEEQQKVLDGLEEKARNKEIQSVAQRKRPISRQFFSFTEAELNDAKKGYEKFEQQYDQMKKENADLKNAEFEALLNGSKDFPRVGKVKQAAPGVILTGYGKVKEEGVKEESAKEEQDKALDIEVEELTKFFGRACITSDFVHKMEREVLLDRVPYVHSPNNPKETSSTCLLNPVTTEQFSHPHRDVRHMNKDLGKQNKSSRTDLIQENGVVSKSTREDRTELAMKLASKMNSAYTVESDKLTPASKRTTLAKNDKQNREVFFSKIRKNNEPSRPVYGVRAAAKELENLQQQEVRRKVTHKPG